MHRELEDVLRKRLGHLAPTVIEIEKKKLGLREDDIPEHLREDFIRGVLFICKNEVEIDLDPDLQQELKRSFR